MAIFDKKNIESIRKTLIARSETIAVAESVTGGFLQASLSSANNALKFFQGGITAYNLGQKSRHLHVDPIEAENNNCVSTKVALEMALNVCELFHSDWGLSITGYSSPVPESGNKLFAYYAISLRKKIVHNGKIEAEGNNPEKVQIFYVRKILEEFNNYAKLRI
jgi:nicotinamide-nucleotide amidase